MASVANCPHCDHELLIPDETNLATWAQCPACAAIFQLEETMLRKVAELLPTSPDAPTIVSFDDETETAESKEQVRERQAKSAWEGTVGFSSAKTITGFGSESEGAVPSAAEHDSATHEVSDHDAAAAAGTTPVTNVPIRSAGTVTDFSSAATVRGVDEPDSSHEELPAHDDSDSSAVASSDSAPLTESVEEAAERIEKWFRSSKTVPEVPPVPSEQEEASGDFEEAEEIEAAPPKQPQPADLRSAVHNALVPDELTDDSSDAATAAAAGASNDFSEHVEGGADPELEFAESSDSPSDMPTWDDSEHMERLLSEMEPQPSEDLQPVTHLSITPPEQEREPEESDDDPAAWMRAHPPVPVRRTSPVRTLLMVTVGGLFGLAAGAYVLLWLFHQKGDLLNVAQYIPKQILPAAFSDDHVAAPPMEVSDAHASDKKNAAGLPASYVETETPSSVRNANKMDKDDDRYTVKSGGLASQPSRFEEPTDAKDMPASSSPQVHNAPSYTADALLVSLRNARQAQPGLVAGELNDPAVQKVKGGAYQTMCGLAEQLTFVDPSSTREILAPLVREAESLFRTTLADAHTRGEVAHIAPVWIPSLRRQNSGVFFAGTVTGQETKGSVVECRVDLGVGVPVTVLLSEELAGQLSLSGGPVGIVGSIVDNPNQQVSNYTGNASRAVWASHVITLKQ